MPPVAADLRVDVPTAREHVLFAISRTFRGDVREPASATFHVADVTNGPYPVFDLEEPLLLFYLFPVHLPGDGRQSWMLAAADKRVGSPVVAVMTPRVPWDPDAVIRYVKNQFGPGPDPARLVAYHYPRMGFPVTHGAFGAAVVDLATSDQVPAAAPVAKRLGRRSFFQKMTEPEAEDRISRWDREHTRIAATLRELGIEGLTAGQDGQPDPGAPRVETRLLRCPPNRSDECFVLQGQQKQEFCTAATTQMILGFHGHHYTQDRIASVLGIEDGSLPTSEDEQAAFGTLSNGCLAATIKWEPDWSVGTAEIDVNRPFRDAIDDHVRVGIGWLEESDPATGEVLRRMLRLCDPQPDNPDPSLGGQFVWEDWDAVVHESILCVRQGDTPCGPANGG